MDKRAFHTYLNNLKETIPNRYIGLVEGIQETFETEIEPISDRERVALRSLPEQFVMRIKGDTGEWTTQLHIWAEHQLPEVLEVYPMLLTHKNSFGDSILMTYVKAILGAYTQQVDYKKIQDLLNKDFGYVVQTTDKNTGDLLETEYNALEVNDYSGTSPLDYLIDFAYGEGEFAGTDPDPKMVQIIESLVASLSPDEEALRSEPKKVEQSVEPQSKAPAQENSQSLSVNKK